MKKSNSPTVHRSNSRAPDGLLLELSLAGVERHQQAAQLMAQLREAIRTGVLPAGTRLPASRTLATDLDVSRGTVVRTYEQLTAEGYLLSHQGSGTQVADLPTASATPPKASVRPPTNPGLPSGSAFPRTAWMRATQRAWATLPDAALSYGDPAGFMPLRQELSAYLGRARALIAPPERIIITTGFAQGARLLADALAKHDVTRIGLEDPGSAGLRKQFARIGVAHQPVPVDSGGLAVETLRTTDLKAVVATPAHQFPTGAVMPPERRHTLVRWARDRGGVVIEDDYDAEYRYDHAPVGALQGLDAEVVAYGGSVSKTLAPGLRIGWLVLPDHLVEPVVTAKYDADLSTGIHVQAAFSEFLANGDLDRHIRKTAVTYRARRDRLTTALNAHFPDWTVTGTAAGLHVLVRLRQHEHEAALANAALECGLDARPLASYRITGGGQPGLVIGYGNRRASTLEQAITSFAVRVNSRPRSSWGAA